MSTWHKRLELLEALSPDDKAKAFLLVQNLPEGVREAAVPVKEGLAVAYMRALLAAGVGRRTVCMVHRMHARGCHGVCDFRMVHGFSWFQLAHDGE